MGVERMSTRLTPGLLLLAALTTVLPDAPAWAKEPCPDGVPKTADLGFRTLTCNCYRRSVNGHITWRFFDEPRIDVVTHGGPADGRLEEGDVITAIDGALITTRDGASRLGHAAPGEAIVLTVRRDGRE